MLLTCLNWEVSIQALNFRSQHESLVCVVNHSLPIKCYEFSKTLVLALATRVPVCTCFPAEEQETAQSKKKKKWRKAWAEGQVQTCY